MNTGLCTIRSCSGVPSSGLGVVCDTDYRTDSPYSVYSKKTGGSLNKPVNPEHWVDSPGRRIEVPGVSSRAMSVVAAMKLSDCICVMADSRLTYDCGVETTARKLYALPNQRVAWGTAGDAGIGNLFGDWLRALEWPTDPTWRWFADAAASELARHNGRKRELAKQSGVEVKENDTTVALLAGYVGGTPAIYELTDRGSVEELTDGQFIAIGSGRAHAFIANATLTTIGARFPQELQWLSVIMAVAARHAPDCGLPLHGFRITPETISELADQKNPSA